ncbi:MAG: hypothetical protein E7662_06785 [Ruminococcaceae bacterium]|nr:hypothetical protein [Oscillospiraceae bacterium]
MNINDRISPIAKQVEYLEGEPMLLGVSGEACCSIEESFSSALDLAVNAVAKLKSGLSALLGACPCAENGIRITLQLKDAPDGMINSDQGYEIIAQNDTISLNGFGEAGLYYAVTTLLQCLRMESGEVRFPAVHIVDSPDLKTRGHFMETRFGSNLMELDDWKEVVDHMEELKQNQLSVSVYGCWCVQYDGKVSEYLYLPIHKYPKLKAPVYGKYYSPKKHGWVNFEKLPPMVEKDYFAELIAYGKAKGVEVLPMFNSFGHNTLIPNMYPEVSAKDENGEPTRTGFCTSNPKTYELMFDVYDEIIDRYLKPNGITSFDIGLDEVSDGIAQNAEDIYRVRSPWCACPDCAGKSKIERFIAHTVKLASHLKEKGMTSIYMYCDMLCNKNRGLGDEDSCKMMMEALRENDLLDVVCFDWWTYSDNQAGLMFQTIRPELGVRSTVKPWNGYYHWNAVTHTLNNTYLLTKMAREEGAEGLRSYSAWDRSYERTHQLQADYAWNFEGAGSVENTKERYLRRNFKTRYAEAKRAMDLMDLCVRIPGGDAEKNVPSRYTIILRSLSYYFYSYVAKGKPYPRQFPGEIFAQYGRNTAFIEEVREIASHAAFATAIFEDLAKDPCVNYSIAKRYRYETLNYAAMCEDFLTIVEMDKVLQSGCPCAFDKIRALAKERKEARLALMVILENTKEAFLIPSHMRNQSIFMQYFADLEAYLANTDAADVKLDFSDNTHFASQAFWNLR